MKIKLLNNAYPGLPVLTFLQFLLSCNALPTGDQNKLISEKDSAISCHSNIPARFKLSQIKEAKEDLSSAQKSSHDGMIHIKEGTFVMGSSDKDGRSDEYPVHSVKLKPFWIDETEVTNGQFKKFVEATGYITTAEKNVDWNELKKQLPEGTEVSPEQLLPSSLVFQMNANVDDLSNYNEWWEWVHGANWKHPRGPRSGITGKDNFPVVQVSWYDAIAYCKWAHKSLPTEAQWEFAARGGLTNKSYPWGDEEVESGMAKTNTWQGKFPAFNTDWDHFEGSAPVKSFEANPYGLYDMAGNVWEWCSDWYRNDFYRSAASHLSVDPKGPDDSYDPDEPLIAKRVVRGGSFLCNASYCKGYRVSSRMKTSPDTGLEHTGFRCVSNE